MVKEEIVGTYWYVINKGKRWITQGSKPTHSNSGGFIRYGEGMGWLNLDDKDYTYRDRTKITSSDFNSINFPDIEPEVPVEIEIVKSGRVYVYEP